MTHPSKPARYGQTKPRKERRAPRGAPGSARWLKGLLARPIALERRGGQLHVTLVERRRSPEVIEQHDAGMTARLHLHYAHRSMPHQPLSAQTQWDPSIRDWTLPALTYMQWAWGASLHFYAFQIRNVELSARLSFSHNITQSTNRDIETVRPSGASRRVYTGFGPIRSGRGLQVDVTPLELRIGRHAAFSVYTSYEEHQLTFDSGTDLSAPPADINTKIANQIATMDDIYITLGAKLSWVH